MKKSKTEASSGKRRQGMDLEFNRPQPEGLSLGPKSTNRGLPAACAPLDLLLSP